jgi:hypothetical protein
MLGYSQFNFMGSIWWCWVTAGTGQDSAQQKVASGAEMPDAIL